METNNLERRLHPHHATITLKLDVRKIDKDGGLDKNSKRKAGETQWLDGKTKMCLV